MYWIALAIFVTFDLLIVILTCASYFKDKDISIGNYEENNTTQHLVETFKHEFHAN